MQRSKKMTFLLFASFLELVFQLCKLLGLLYQHLLGDLYMHIALYQAS